MEEVASDILVLLCLPLAILPFFLVCAADEVQPHLNDWYSFLLSFISFTYFTLAEDRVSADLVDP